MGVEGGGNMRGKFFVYIMLGIMLIPIWNFGERRWPR